MQDTLTVWNSKEIKRFLEKVHDQWGGAWKPAAAFISNTSDRVFLVTRDIAKIDWQKLRMSSVGLYIGEYHDDKIRLSIEGSQLVGPTATKNIIDLDKETAMKWLKGHDIEVDSQDLQGHVIVRCGSDYMGSGAYKEGVLLNHVPKARRLPEQA